MSQFVSQEPEGWLKELVADKESGARLAQDGIRPSRYELDVEAGKAQPMPKPEDSFHNQRAPTVTIQYEKPEHRVILVFKMQMLSNEQIAEKTGYTTEHVKAVLRQPWAIEWMQKEAVRMGQSEVDLLLKGEAANCIRRAIAMRDNKEGNVPYAVQAQANRDIMDRIWGKPTQPIFQQDKDPNKLSDEELAKMANGQN